MRHNSASGQGLAPPQADIIIVGGRQAGLSLAALLGTRGFKIICLERSDNGAAAARQDGRTVALSLRTVRLLRQAKIWPLIERDACPIRDIRIADQDSSAVLDFHHGDVGPEPFGWIIENHLFLNALFKRIGQLPAVRLINGASVVALDTAGALAKVTLADESLIKAPLVIGADGRGSICRRLAGIATYGWDYPQSALICNIAHAWPHRHSAVEHFLPGGPFAVLPMTDDKTSRALPHRSSIVWTEKTATAATLMQMDDAEFNGLLQEKVAPYLGEARMISPRQAYPLQLQHAKSYIAPRLALIGDAAHGIHPIAGQGFNLGIGDIAALDEELNRAARLGLDLGSADVLGRYQKRRKADNGTMVLATDLLDRLFSNALPPVQAARRFGLGAVQRLPRLKQFFMRTAMGLREKTLTH